MATNSILKNIKINNKPLASSFAQALENANKIQGKDVSYKKIVRDVPKEDIKKFLGDKLK